MTVQLDPADTGPRNPPIIPWGQMLPSKTEQTLPKYPADMHPTDGSWEIVNGTRYKFFVFSAFYDRRDGRLVRVIGATKTRGPEKVWCRFWYKTGENTTRYRSASVMARVKVGSMGLFVELLLKPLFNPFQRSSGRTGTSSTARASSCVRSGDPSRTFRTPLV